MCARRAQGVAAGLQPGCSRVAAGLQPGCSRVAAGLQLIWLCTCSSMISGLGKGCVLRPSLSPSPGSLFTPRPWAASCLGFGSG